MEDQLRQNIKVWCRRMEVDAPPPQAEDSVTQKLLGMGYERPGRQAAMVVAAGRWIATQHPKLGMEQRRFAALWAAKLAYAQCYGEGQATLPAGVPAKAKKFITSLSEQMVAARTEEEEAPNLMRELKRHMQKGEIQE